MKKCSKCKEYKLDNQFSPYKRNKDGLQSQCKVCKKDAYLSYLKTEIGILTTRYHAMVTRTKIKKLPPVSFTKEEFIYWAINSSDFRVIFKKWEENKYIKSLSPSVDRLDDYLGYQLDNIQFTTWEYNNKKGLRDRVIGNNSKKCKKVVQSNLKNRYLKTFISIKKASEITGVKASNISKCCNKKRKTAGGFIWNFKK